MSSQAVLVWQMHLKHGTLRMHVTLRQPTRASVSSVLQIMLGCLKHQWHVSSKATSRQHLIGRLDDLVSELLLDTAKAELCASFSASAPGTPSGAISNVAGTPTHTTRFALPAASSALPHAGEALGLTGVTAPYDRTLRSAVSMGGGTHTMQHSTRTSMRRGSPPPMAPGMAGVGLGRRPRPPLLAKAYFCLAQWHQAVSGKVLDDAQAWR